VAQFQDVHFAVYDSRTKDALTFKVDISQEGFDGHCTHAEIVGEQGMLFINYTSRQLMLLDTTEMGLTPAANRRIGQ
jgi:hypothetical protein